MIQSIGLAVVFAFCLGLTACDTAYMAAMEKMGYAKRDILSSRVKSARDAQEDAKKEIQSALEQFGKVVGYQGGDLEAAYKKLNNELQHSEDSADAVRKRIKDVESLADSLFAEWKTELGQYSSADLRHKSEEKLSQTKARYQVLYLEHNLNARALAATRANWSKSTPRWTSS